MFLEFTFKDNVKDKFVIHNILINICSCESGFPQVVTAVCKDTYSSFPVTYTLQNSHNPHYTLGKCSMTQIYCSV